MNYPNPKARYQPPTSKTFAGAHKAAVAGQNASFLRDWENIAEKDSSYWQNMAQDYRDRVLEVLTDAERELVEDALRDYEASVTAMARGLGWRRAMDHVNLCRLRRYPLYLNAICYKVCGQRLLVGDPAIKAQVGYDAR